MNLKKQIDLLVNNSQQKKTAAALTTKWQTRKTTQKCEKFVLLTLT